MIWYIAVLKKRYSTEFESYEGNADSEKNIVSPFKTWFIFLSGLSRLRLRISEKIEILKFTIIHENSRKFTKIHRRVNLWN